MDRLVAFDHAPVTQPVPDVPRFSAGVVVLVLVVTTNRVLANVAYFVGAFWVGVTGNTHIPNSHAHAVPQFGRGCPLMSHTKWHR